MKNKIKQLYSALSRVQAEIDILTATKKIFVKELADEYMKLPIKEVSFEDRQKLLNDDL